MVCAREDADLLATGCALEAAATALMDCLANIVYLAWLQWVYLLIQRGSELKAPGSAFHQHFSVNSIHSRSSCPFSQRTP